MTWILIGCVLLLGLMLGGAGMRTVGRMARRSWRPGAGFLAMLAFVGAAFFGVRENIPAAVVLALIGVSLTMSVRRTRRAGATGTRIPAARDMGVEAAASILGVSPQATDEEVQAAYLRLIRRVHPDAGGAEGLAAQLNAARDVMARRGR
ncbi:MAG: hypothetical protein B7Y99_05790 [Caulobacterales bacterium 32-69-10]|nr:MAG: hypothetical protein B7Y99_05790 [Caulobacterales bacterium 32-69-10]